MKPTISRKIKFVVIAIGILVVAWLIYSYSYSQNLITAYKKQESPIITDRYGKLIAVLPNANGYTNEFISKKPDRLTDLLLKKEDRFFYWHKGINPISIIEALLGRVGITNRAASSTITQQLAKVILGNENNRTISNKIKETIGALALETNIPKSEILKMYLNSIYFGNRTQGINSASAYYFDKDPEMLTDGEILSLIATVSNPSRYNPLENENQQEAKAIGRRLEVDLDQNTPIDPLFLKKRVADFSFISKNYFEISPTIRSSCQTTIDSELTDKIRLIVQDNLALLSGKNANNAAVTVIKVPENEILATIGSPDPAIDSMGYRINMLKKPRPIGSTIKPFIYLKAFEKGLRPYTIVDDREYKYITAMGFPLYPKNYDYQYRGKVSLHYALSNSLNVPAVKVLEYIGLENFNDFLLNDLSFKPNQPIESYQLGIALGSLDMPLLDLAHYFTIFPNSGILKPLTLKKCATDEQLPLTDKTIARAEYVALINKVLSDRKTGVEQFGLNSELNLPQNNYALKTGTSRDFKDSWVVGYTPDFLVAVWVGNADNSSTNEVSGQTGAGTIWMQVMELLMNSQYDKKTPFNFSALEEFNTSYGIDYGLGNDNFGAVVNILESADKSLITNPHNGDNIIINNNSVVNLIANEPVDWFVDDIFLGNSASFPYRPITAGKHTIKAIATNKEESITIFIERE